MCEALCRGWIIRDPIQVPSAALDALIDSILGQMLLHDSVAVWRWEKRPSRPDYLYPPDWDDTCKAIDAIRAYEVLTGQSLDVPLPTSKWLAQELKASFHVSPVAGQDSTRPCRNQLALFMFLAGRDEKPNNTEDIMVTAVTLRTVLRFYRDVAMELEGELLSLGERLLEVACWGLLDGIRFSEVSRCYYSWGHFLLILHEIGELLPFLRPRITEQCSIYLRGRLYSSLLDDNIRSHLAQDEACYAAFLARLVAPEIEPVLVSHARRLGQAESPQVMYRHRRLGHMYGAPAWTYLLYRLLATSDAGGLEADV
ncbi:MAG: hypothetical protein JW889_03370 [Verrucomicrobia bacterium]|nr:hypothetical protein [Verrucomicrobiota bacterium]